MASIMLLSHHQNEDVELQMQRLVSFNSANESWKAKNLEDKRVSTEPSYFQKNNLNQLVLNISGFKYEILIKKLNQIQSSRLEKIYHANSIEVINDLCDLFKPNENELYFDRDPSIFNNILNYYRSGKMHVLDNVCPIAFKDELEFWGLNEIVVENCCSLKFFIKKEEVLEEIKKFTPNENINELQEKKNVIKKNCYFAIKEKIWDILDRPETSNIAKVIIIAIDVLFYIFCVEKKVFVFFKILFMI